MTTRATYEAPKLEVQYLRKLPSALASSCNGSAGSNSCSDSASNVRKH